MSADRSDGPVMQDRQSQLEQAFIDEFLRLRGCDPEHLSTLPAADVERLMRQACIYASGKLAEVEARAHFVHDIHGGAEDAHRSRHK
jgi:hypothetical protein